MGIETLIEYCDSTANIAVGCDGCELYDPKHPESATCYAFELVSRYAGLKGWPAAFDKPTIFAERMKLLTKWSDLTGKDRPNKPWLNGMPRIVFFNDLGDTFTKSLPELWLLDYVPLMMRTLHIYLIFTKLPKRAKFFYRTLGSVPANFWPIVSITSQETAFRLLQHAEIDSPHLGLSIEPVLGPIKLDQDALKRISWAALGSESGSKARLTEHTWVEDLVAQLQEADVKIFYKQDAHKGRKISLPVLNGRQWTEMPRVL